MSGVKFEACATRYSVPITDDQMLALIDSESYATGHAAFAPGKQTLCEKLKATAARNVEYNGHFGAHVVLELDSEDDTAANKRAISAVISAHLKWCQKQAVIPNVAERRAPPPTPVDPEEETRA